MIRKKVAGVLITVLFIISSLQVQSSEDEDNRGASFDPHGMDVIVDFDYVMEERFGLDLNGDNLVDLPNTLEYVQNDCMENLFDPPTFVVLFKAGVSAPDELMDKYTIRYVWRIDPVLISPDYEDVDLDSYRIRGNTDVDEFITRLPEGVHDVMMRALFYRSTEEGYTTPGPVTPDLKREITHRITIEDILIVSLGDSYSSGEGNPERPQDGTDSEIWARSGVSGNDGSAIDKYHRLSSRSTLAWPAQIALYLEYSDDHSSVTFVSFAETGACIEDIDSRIAREIGPWGVISLSNFPNQIHSAKDVTMNRRIDTLMISIGGNDIGFSKIITSLIGHDYICDPSLKDISNAVHNGNWDNIDHLFETKDFGWDSSLGLDDLHARMDDMAEQIEDELDPMNVNILQFPNFLRRSWGSKDYSIIDKDSEWDFTEKTYYSYVLQDAGNIIGPIGWGYIDNKEAAWAARYVLNPLNGVIRRIADKYNWALINENDRRDDGEEFDFTGHGYGSDSSNNPYSYKGRLIPKKNQVHTSVLRNPFLFDETVFTPANCRNINRYVNTEHDGIYRQEPEDFKSNQGTMHPNEIGHSAISYGTIPILDLPNILLQNERIGELSRNAFGDAPDCLYNEFYDESSIYGSVYKRLGGNKVNYEGMELTRRLDKRTDVDFYKIIPYDDNTKLTISLPSPNNRKAHLRVFDSNGVQIDEFLKKGVIELPVDKEYYYIAVSGKENDEYEPITGWGRKDGEYIGYYTLDIQYTWNTRGSVLRSAEKMVLNGVYEIIHECGYDVDMFRLDKVSRNTHVSFTIEPLSDQQVPAMVLHSFVDNENKVVATSQDGYLEYDFHDYYPGWTDMDAFVPLCSSEIFDSYLQIHPSDFEIEDYLKESGLPTCFEECTKCAREIGLSKLTITFEYDVDDTISSANVIGNEFPQKVEYFALCPDDDVDMFRFDAQSRTQYRLVAVVHVTAYHADLKIFPSINVTVYSRTGEELASQTVQDGVNSIKYRCIEGGTLYFKIEIVTPGGIIGIPLVSDYTKYTVSINAWG